MNIHHLELFYHVACHGGISQAARKIPYGIQQPAISSQILQLEKDLGVSLFQRRPFQLTEAGTRLAQFIEPFFSRLDDVADEIRGRALELRVGASRAVLHDYFPSVLLNLQKRIPLLRIKLHEGTESALLEQVEKNEIDLAVTSLDRKLNKGLTLHRLAELPLILLLPSSHPIRFARSLWVRKQIEEPLISTAPDDALSRSFQRGLLARNLQWETGITVNSLDLIETYVSHGFGLGVSVAIPGRRLREGVRSIPLPGFDPVRLYALWRGKVSPTLELVVQEMDRQAASVFKA